MANIEWDFLPICAETFLGLVCKIQKAGADEWDCVNWCFVGDDRAMPYKAIMKRKISGITRPVELTEEDYPILEPGDIRMGPEADIDDDFDVQPKSSVGNTIIEDIARDLPSPSANEQSSPFGHYDPDGDYNKDENPPPAEEYDPRDLGRHLEELSHTLAEENKKNISASDLLCPETWLD